MARTTVLDTIERVRRQLASAQRLEYNFLASAMDNVQTTLTLSLDVAKSIRPGAFVFIDTEAMRVTSVDTTTKIVTVARGYYDSDPVAHSNGAEVQVNPRFSPLDIMDAMQDEILSYGPQLYRVSSTEIAVASSQETVALPVTWNDAYGLVDVTRKWTDDDTATAWPRCEVRFARGGATAFAGAPFIRVIDNTRDGTVLVKAARPFDVSTFTASTDLVATVGLPASMLDVVAMGTKLRLLVDSENSRGGRDVQDEPRRAEETPVAAAVQPFQFNNAVYRSRKQEEINKLVALYPIRMA